MKYTKEMVDFLEKNIKGISYKELTIKFNLHFGVCVTVNTPVSYTHLDVYKRQGSHHAAGSEVR